MPCFWKGESAIRLLPRDHEPGRERTIMGYTKNLLHAEVIAREFIPLMDPALRTIAPSLLLIGGLVGFSPGTE